MSTIVVIAISACAFVLGILGYRASSVRELLPDTDGVPYWNDEAFERDSKLGTRLFVASTSLALIGTVISLVWK